VTADRDGPLRLHPALGYRIRAGSWKDHERSTYDLCLEAIAEQRWDDAIALAEYTIHEATEPHELYRDWIPQIRDFLVRNGVAETDVERDEAALLERLRQPDGTPFDPEAGWRATCAHTDAVIAACRHADGDRAARELENARRVWLATHDRKCDWVQGMIGIVALRLGEARIGELWDLLMAPMFDSYDKYDVERRPWPESAEQLLQVTAEALRGHLSGPQRRGTIEYVEEPGRRGFRFTPCGSGGRNFSGETFGSYPVTSDRHDWAWNMKGVCLYCAHCCALSERNPIKRFGYPARAVEPPYRNESGERTHCTWWIYDDPRDVPREVYERTGNRKPDRIGGTGAVPVARSTPDGDSKK